MLKSDENYFIILFLEINIYQTVRVIFNQTQIQRKMIVS